MSSPSSSSRRWADYTDDEEDEVPRRSYCEVLRSGSPPVEPGSGAASSSVARKGVASPVAGPGGVDPSMAVAAAGRPWAVDEGNRRVGGERREAQGRGAVAQAGQAAHQRLGPREQLLAVDRELGRGAASEQEDRVEVAPGRNGVESPPEVYRIPARQRVGLVEQPPRQGVRAPSPPPVEVVVTRLPARMRLGERERSPPPPPPPPPAPLPHVLEAVGSSSRAAPHGRAAGREPEPRRLGARAEEERHTDVRGEARTGLGRHGHKRVESVFISRTAEVDVAKDALRYAFVAFVAGSRAYVTLSEARAALVARVPRAEDNITVHRSRPGDFLFVCSSRRVRDEVLAVDAAHGRDFSLRFTPWNRQLQAMHSRLRYRAHFELTGVPAHAWNRTTAVLSSDAWVECLGAATANREDLGSFQVVA
ncbi:hypothetical protein ACQ4PT_034306 [Festuca glaucescens]